MRRLLPVLLLFAVGCSPLYYVKKSPIEPPQPVEAPTLAVPTLTDADCGRFTFNNLTGWEEAPWVQPGGVIDTIEPGDIHPAVGESDHLVRCRHVAVPPGWWVISREARDRYPLMRSQLDLWRGYSARAAERHQQESEEIASLLKLARRRQIEAGFIGIGVGAGAAVAAILTVVLIAR